MIGKFEKESQASYERMAKLYDCQYYELVNNGYKFVNEGELWHAVLR